MEFAWADRPDNARKILPLLHRLVSHEHRHGMTVDQLTRNIAEGRYKLWVLGDVHALFMTSTYTQHNGRLVLSLSWASGDDALQPTVVLPKIEAYARDQGCYAIEIMGRRGWERVVRDYGFGHFYTGLIKEL